MGDKYVYTEHLSAGYGKRIIVDDINIELRRGEILTLIGPNGAGKSTILKTLSKQLSLIAGCIYIDGNSVEQMTDRELALKMSVVLTDRLTTELMTCYDIVATGRYPYTGKFGVLSKADRRKVLEALSLVHAKDLADCDFLNISDGQRQRILLARAICQEPEIIVLDEPTSFLDIKHKLELLTILKEMVLKNNISVVMSLHELDLAQKISDYVVCVNNNQIDKYGEPEEIFNSEYIGQLYGVCDGSYNNNFGCVEMKKIDGAAKVFVIGGNASASNTYRKLWRKGIPFATGILHENDVDYQIAAALASNVISESPFNIISDENFNKAFAVASECQKVICPLKDFGIMNEKNRVLLEKILALGIELCYDI